MRGTIKRTIRAALCAAMVLAGLTVPAAGAAANEDDLVEEAVSAEAADVTSPSDRLPMTSQMRQAVVAALQADLAAPGRTQAERARTRSELAKLVGPEAAYAAATQSASTLATTGPSNKLLIIAHAAQEKGYYRGPASAYMMLKYLGYTTSRYNGVALSQTNLASSTYLATDSNSSTPWTGKGMQTGINKWMQGSAYVQVQSPSLSVVRGAFVSTIAKAGQPLAADTVEFQGGAHYNGHPDRTIGHWIVGYGYSNMGDQTYWLDPATSYYPNAAKVFTAQTASFVSFLQSNGIMY